MARDCGGSYLPNFVVPWRVCASGRFCFVGALYLSLFEEQVRKTAKRLGLREQLQALLSNKVTRLTWDATTCKTFEHQVKCTLALLEPGAVIQPPSEDVGSCTPDEESIWDMDALGSVN